MLVLVKLIILWNERWFGVGKNICKIVGGCVGCLWFGLVMVYVIGFW